MPKVLNKHFDVIPADAVYIGRPGPWGNPFPISEHTTREDSLRKYEAYLERHPKLRKRIKEELKGKNLICFCAPRACHGDILVRIANE